MQTSYLITPSHSKVIYKGQYCTCICRPVQGIQKVPNPHSYVQVWYRYFWTAACARTEVSVSPKTLSEVQTFQCRPRHVVDQQKRFVASCFLTFPPVVIFIYCVCEEQFDVILLPSNGFVLFIMCSPKLCYARCVSERNSPPTGHETGVHEQLDDGMYRCMRRTLLNREELDGIAQANSPCSTATWSMCISMWSSSL